jgi:transcriptional regulator with XRE-family HTH domain
MAACIIRCSGINVKIKSAAMNIAGAIIEARKRQGLTQEELADKAGLTVRTIQRIESGKGTPRDFTLRQIAAALNLPVDELKSKPELQDDYWMVLLNLSAFCYLLLPLLNIIVPLQLLKKHRHEIDAGLARKIINRQIYWSIATHALLLLLLLYNLVQSARWHNLYAVGYFFPVILLFGINAALILSMHFHLVNKEQPIQAV